MPQKWKTIRIFVSSTFLDMHTERDHLVRFVFPELKEKCRKKRVHLIDVDLRWGVTEADAQDGKALDICLDEIDSCRPYFLGLLGHRYGWTPPGQEHSITAQEIYHGVLHNDVPRQLVDLQQIIDGRLEGKALTSEQIICLVRCYQWEANKGKYLLIDDTSSDDLNTIRSIFHNYSVYQKDRSFFFFRSETLSRELAGQNINDFFEPDDVGKEKLTLLKQEIIDDGLPYFEYNDIETFGHQLGDILWKRIEAELEQTEEAIEKDWLEEETELHELFMTDRTRRFVGRRDFLNRMNAFCDGQNESIIMVITGDPGCGKSALMARYAEEAIHNHPDWITIPHFVGASPSSTNLRQTLKRFCTILNQLNNSSEEIPEDIKELIQVFPDLMAKASEERKILFIVDAVNQLEKTDNAHDMHWLPQELHENVKFVISTLAGDPLDALMLRTIKPMIETVTGLKEGDIKELVTGYLAEIRREFPNKEVEKTFFNKVKAGNPLYIQVALEELRVFGQFEELARRVNELPDNVADLFNQVLERIESDFNPQLVRDCMNFIACGRYGMTAEELQTLLKVHAPHTESDTLPAKLPDMLWARLYRAFSAYLFERSGVIDFFHSQLKEAVGERYLPEEKDQIAIHKAIANYFENRWKEPYYRALDELPHQHIKSLDLEGVEIVLTDLEFIEAKCSAQMYFSLLRDYTEALYVSAPAWKGKKRVEEFKKFLTKNIHILRRHSGLTFQQALYYSETSGPHKAAVKLLKANKINKPWFELKNKTQLNSNCIITITCHTIGMRTCAFSPDGKKIASGDFDKNLKVWDAESSEEILSLTGHSGWIASCIFSPDGQRIVSASLDHSLKVWDANNGTEIYTLSEHLNDVVSCAFSHDGKRIVSASVDRSLKVWNAESGDEIFTLTGHSDVVFSCAFSPDGKKIVSGSRDEKLKVWNAETSEEIFTLTGHSDVVTSCAFSPDGQRIVSGSNDKSLKVWDAETSEEIFTLTGHSDFVTSCAFSPDGGRIVSGSSDKSLKIWGANTEAEIFTLTGHSGGIKSCTFSPDGRRILSGDGFTLKIWDAESYLENLPPTNHNGPVESCAFSPDGRRIASGSEDHCLKVWDAGGSNEMFALKGHLDTVNSCDFSPDGLRIVSGSWDHSLKVWDAINGTEIFTLTGHLDGVNNCSFSPDGRRIVSASWDHSLKVWDAISGMEIFTLTGHSDWVNSFSFSPDGKRIVSGSRDKNLKIWDAESGEEIFTLTALTSANPFSNNGWRNVSMAWDTMQHFFGAESHVTSLMGHTASVNSCTFSPDGMRIVSGSEDHSLRIWDANNGKIIFTLGHSESVSSCAFSPDGRRIVSASIDHSLKVWDAISGTEIFTLTGHNGPVTSCTFSPDGRRIISVSGNYLTVWDVESGNEISAYWAEGNIMAVDLDSSGCIVAADNLGMVYILSMMGVQPDAPVISPLLVYRFQTHNWDNKPTAKCKWCGTSFELPDTLISAINFINAANKSSSAPPNTIADLAPEAWDDPNLLSECPGCHKQLKFNPFIVDNRSRY